MGVSSGDVWVVTTGEAGNVSQAVGLAQGVGLPFSAKSAQVRKPWAMAPSTWAAMAGLERLLEPEDVERFAPPWPRAVIACGRRAATLSLAVRRAAVKDGARAPFLIQMLNPQVSLANFDLVIAPDHDRLEGANVLTSLGAVHRLTRDALESGARRFEDVFRDLPRPLAAVLIGGSSGSYRFGIQDARRFADQLAALVEQEGVGLAVTTSRRTGEDETALMRKALGGLPGVWFWNGEAPNPFIAMLALADVILVTEDSVSMISEACFTGKPVYTLDLTGGSVRFTRFHQRMEEEGYTRPYRGSIRLWRPPAPLDEAARLGALARARLDAS